MPSKHKSNNPSGRPAGSPNRTTQEMRQLLQHLIDLEFDRIQEDLIRMDADKRMDIVLKLLPYCLPKINPVDPEPEIGRQPGQLNTIKLLTQRMMENAAKIKAVREQEHNS